MSCRLVLRSTRWASAERLRRLTLFAVLTLGCVHMFDWLCDKAVHILTVLVLLCTAFALYAIFVPRPW